MTQNSTEREEGSSTLRDHSLGGDDATTRPMRDRMGALDFFERTGLIIVLGALVVFFGTSSIGNLFLSSINIYNIMVSGAVVGVVALAMLPPLIAGHFDLSVAAIAGVSNVAIASAISAYGAPIWVAILIGLGIGLAIGAINGFLVAQLGLNAFIVTFGTFTVLTGVIAWYTGGQQIVQGIPDAVGAWSGSLWFGVPAPFVTLLLVAVLLWYGLMSTPWGRFLEAIGSNHTAAHLVGINVDRTVWSAFVLSGGLAGVAGVIVTTIIGGGDPTAASSYLFPAFAAVFLGATAIRPGRYNVWGTIIGVYLVGSAVSGLTLLGAESWVQPVLNGATLILAVGLSTFLRRSSVNRAARKVKAQR